MSHKYVATGKTAVYVIVGDAERIIGYFNAAYITASTREEPWNVSCKLILKEPELVLAYLGK